MIAAAPRIPWPIVHAIGRLDTRDVPIAEVWRRTCDLAAAIGVYRPSYEQIRRFVHRERSVRDVPGSTDVIIESLLRVRSPLSGLDELIERSIARRAGRASAAYERGWRPAT